MKVSVIIPVLNERGTILELLGRVDRSPVDKEIIVVDDGSSDGTAELLAQVREPPITLVVHRRNLGKGGAVRSGLARVSGDIVLIQDADLEYDPEEYPQLIAPILEGRARVVYGSRVMKRDNPRSSQAFYWGGRLVTMATNLLFGSRLTDEPTCYKVFATEVIKQTPWVGDGFEWEPEVTAKLLRRGVEIVETPISYHPRQVEEGKKIRPWDGLKAIWTLIRYRFAK